jgi:hypothetical protein
MQELTGGGKKVNMGEAGQARVNRREKAEVVVGGAISLMCFTSWVP